MNRKVFYLRGSDWVPRFADGGPALGPGTEFRNGCNL